jgi:Protein of unknown function (DUF2752)
VYREIVSQTTEQPAVPAAPPVYVLPEPGRFTRFLLRLSDRAPVWSAPAAIATCFGGAVAYTLLTDPVNADPFAPPTCLLKLTTGFDCPGCGGTRAFWYLLHGNVPQAARHHAMFVFALPFLVYMYVAWSANLIARRQVLPMLRLSPFTLAAFLGAWLAWSILRNLPWAPFTWLYV